MWIRVDEKNNVCWEVKSAVLQILSLETNEFEFGEVSCSAGCIKEKSGFPLFHTSLLDVGKDLSLLNQSDHVVGERSRVDSHLILWLPYLLSCPASWFTSSFCRFRISEWSCHIVVAWSGRSSHPRCQGLTYKPTWHFTPEFSQQIFLECLLCVI